MSETMAHPVFEAALEGMGPGYVHRFPIHLGGPLPVVPRHAQEAIVPWCAELLTPYVDAARRPRLVALLARVQGKDPTAEERAFVAQALLELGELETKPPPDDPVRIAALLAGCVRRVGRDGGDRNASRTARGAARLTVSTLARVAHGGAPIHFLRALDTHLVRAEVVAAVGRRSPDLEDRLDSVAYRAGAFAMRVAVVRIKPGDGEPAPRWGVLVQHEGFHWSEGALGDALAIVPDALFEETTKAAFRIAGGDPRSR